MNDDIPWLWPRTTEAVGKFHFNEKLRALMLTRGWKIPDVKELLGNAYALGTVRKWHSRAKPMSQRAWDLLQSKLK